MCQAEQFVQGLRKLCINTNLAKTTYSKLGIQKFEFEDGSSIGGMRAWMDAGIITINLDYESNDI